MVNSAVFAVVLGVVGLALPALADEEPKRGGTLNYMIPADAPPSFDGHREATYATVAAKAAIGYELPKLNAIDARIDAVSHPESAGDLVFRERQLLGRTFRGLGLPSPKVIEADEVIVGDGAAVDGT